MKKNLFKIFALFVVIGLLIISCDNVEKPELEMDFESIQDASEASAIVSDVFSTVNSGTSTSKAEDKCGELIYIVASNAMTITYDSCTENEVVKKGVIKASFDGTWGAGATVTITFENYTVNEKTLSGTVTVKYLGIDPNPEFELTATSMSLTFEDGKSITWNSSRTLTWKEGFADIGKKSDDIWQISGESEGTGRNGKSFTRVETELLTSPTCMWFVGGNLDLTIGESDDKYEITYGPACGAVTITYKDRTIQRTY